MDLQRALDMVCNGESDNKTSQKLGITRSMFSAYRTGRKTPSNEILDKMAEMSNLKPIELYLAAYAEKIDNPKVAEQFRHLAA